MPQHSPSYDWNACWVYSCPRQGGRFNGWFSVWAPRDGGAEVSPAHSPAPSCYATFLFLTLLQDHLKVKLESRFGDGISFASPLCLTLLSKSCSALLTPKNNESTQNTASLWLEVWFQLQWDAMRINSLEGASMPRKRKRLVMRCQSRI